MTLWEWCFRGPWRDWRQHRRDRNAWRDLARRVKRARRTLDRLRATYDD